MVVVRLPGFEMQTLTRCIFCSLRRRAPLAYHALWGIRPLGLVSASLSLEGEGQGERYEEGQRMTGWL